MHPETDPSISCEVLEYFLRRLSSPTSRQHAILVSDKNKNKNIQITTRL